MSNPNHTAHFTEERIFTDEFSTEDYKTSDFEKYFLQCHVDGNMNLHRIKNYHWENNDFDIDRKKDENYRGTYHIISEDETERIIRLNLQFYKDNLAGTKETVFNKIIYFYQTSNSTNKGVFSYKRDEFYDYFVNPLSKQNDKLFHCLELAGEKDELRNIELVKKYGENLVDYLEEKFPVYKINEGLKYLHEQINPNSLHDEYFRKYLQDLKDLMDSDKYILIGYLVKFEGNVYKAFENFEKSECFKKFNQLLSRRGDNDLKKQFEFYMNFPTSLYGPNDCLIYYDRKIVLRDEYETYQNEFKELKIEEEEIYKRIFTKTDRRNGKNLPSDYLMSLFHPDIETLKEYGYDDEEKNIEVIKNCFGYYIPPTLKDLINKAYQVYINNNEYFEALTFNGHNQQKNFYPLYIKLGGNLREVCLELMKAKYPQEIEFTRSLKFDDYLVSEFLMNQTKESFEFDELYKNLRYKIFDNDLRKKFELLNVYDDYNFLRMVNNKEIDLEEKVKEFLKSKFTQQLEILNSLKFTDEKKNMEILLNEYYEDIEMNEEFCYKKALNYYNLDENSLIYRYSNYDLNLYKKYLNSGKSKFTEYIKDKIFERFGTIIDSLVQIGFNDNEKNLESILKLNYYGEKDFEENLLKDLVLHYGLDYWQFYKKLECLKLHNNKGFYKEYFESGEKFDETILKFMREPLAFRQEECKKYGFDDEEKNLSFLIDLYDPFQDNIEENYSKLLRVYIVDLEEFRKIENISEEKNVDFYQSYLKHNKEVYLTGLHLNFPSMLPLLEKYNDSEFVYNVAQNSYEVVQTPEELEILNDKFCDYLTSVLNLKINNKQIIIDNIYATELRNSDPKEFFYDLLGRTQNFLRKKKINPAHTNFHNANLIDEFYLDNEEFLLKKMFETYFEDRFSELLIKFPLSTCVYTLSNDISYWRISNLERLMNQLDNGVLNIQERYKVNADPHDIMLLLASNNYEDHLVEKFQKLQDLKLVIEDLKLANPRRNDAFIYIAELSA